LTYFGYELSNNKCEQLLPSSIIGSWRYFRARVDQLHVSNKASHMFFSVRIRTFYRRKTEKTVNRPLFERSFQVKD
jgi:hypothetical protein